jgi:hypothetical protein
LSDCVVLLSYHHEAGNCKPNRAMSETLTTNRT